MVLKKIIDIIKLFYPARICALENYSKYVLSTENKRLNDAKSEVFQAQKMINQIDNIILGIKVIEKLENINNLTSENFDRCFTLKIDFKEEKYLYQLYIRISILAPYYTIYVLSNLIENNPYRWLSTPKRDKCYESSISNEIRFIRKVIENQMDYFLIDEDILNKVIDDISYEDINFGNFTIFNALFTNDR